MGGSTESKSSFSIHFAYRNRLNVAISRLGKDGEWRNGRT